MGSIFYRLKPIKDKEEYEKALAYLEKIIDSKHGTWKFDKLGVLSLLIEEYEIIHYPI